MTPTSTSHPLLGQTAVVTGAAQGLGRCIAQRLAAEGVDVALLDVQRGPLAEAAAEIAGDTGRTAFAIECDVTQAQQIEAAIGQVVERLGRLDIVVANAGIVISDATTDFDASEWRRVVDVNLNGYFLLARCTLPILRAAGGGVIVQINSISGRRGSYRNTAYCASKAAGIGLTQSLALEAADSGVRVNAICPGHLLDSPLWVDRLYSQYARRYQISESEVRRRYIEAVPMRRACTCADVCNLVVFLASPQAAYITGQALNVSGGEVM